MAGDICSHYTINHISDLSVTQLDTLFLPLECNNRTIEQIGPLRYGHIVDMSQGLQTSVWSKGRLFPTWSLCGLLISAHSKDSMQLGVKVPVAPCDPSNIPD